MHDFNLKLAKSKLFNRFVSDEVDHEANVNKLLSLLVICQFKTIVIKVVHFTDYAFNAT